MKMMTNLEHVNVLGRLRDECAMLYEHECQEEDQRRIDALNAAIASLSDGNPVSMEPAKATAASEAQRSNLQTSTPSSSSAEERGVRVGDWARAWDRLGLVVYVPPGAGYVEVETWEDREIYNARWRVSDIVEIRRSVPDSHVPTGGELEHVREIIARASQRVDRAEVERLAEELANDHGAALLSADPSAAVQAKPLPIRNQVICAAIKFADGRIVRGHRHDGCAKYAMGWTPKPDFDGHVQGFIDARNLFVDRKEAMRIQIAAGIPSHDGGRMEDGLVLFSEDLY